MFQPRQQPVPEHLKAGSSPYRDGDDSAKLRDAEGQQARKYLMITQPVFVQETSPNDWEFSATI